MADVLFIIIAALAGLGGGAALAGFFIKNKHAKLEEETKERVKSMLREAEVNAEAIKKDRILEAKEKYLKMKAEFDEEMSNKKNIIITNENKVKQLQQQVSKEQEQIKRKEAELDSKKENLNAQLHAVQVKKEELDRIVNETSKEEEVLRKESEKAKTNIEERLLKAYARVRKNYVNGMAVVPIERNSCGGCFNRIPPQRQSEISQRKKVIVCEHCGRILVDAALIDDVRETVKL